MIPCSKEWLLALCLVSVHLLAPAVAQLPALTPALAKQVDQLVENEWVKCGLDKGSLEDVKKHFSFSHVLDILRTVSGKNAGTPPDIKQDANKALSPEIKQTLLNCLSKHPLVVAAQKSAKNLPIDYINMFLSLLTRDLAQGPPGGAAVLGPAAAAKATPSPSLGKTFSPKPDESQDRSPETAPKEKNMPPTKAKKEDSSGMPTIAIMFIGLSVSAIALLALLCICFFCVCRAKQASLSDVRDDKPLLSLNPSDLSATKPSQGNTIDINKVEASSLKLEAGQSGVVILTSSEVSNTEVHPIVYSSLAEPTAAPTGSVPGSMPTAAPTGSVPGSMPTAAPTGSVPGSMPMATPTDSGSMPMPPTAMPSLGPLATPHPKAPPSSTHQTSTPPSRPDPVLHSEPSPPPAPNSEPLPKAAPPPPPSKSSGPPPPPKSSGPPPPAMPGPSKARPPPLMKKSGNKVDGAGSHEAKTKLKPFFWDKVTANANQSMVWDHINSGSFQFNETKMENLFGYNSTEGKGSNGKKDLSSKDAPQFVRILDPKKAQNLAISLRALSVSPEEVCSAVKEGNELSSDLIDTLTKWTPNNDEELRLRLYTGELSQLGPAEQFLKAIIDIPYIFQRLEALLFMSNLPVESSNVKQSFATLEVACEELKNSRLFLKLLEAVLKTGNRMNVGTFRGGAQAFKLDTLLKLSDVKGTDGKTTLLHFVVQEIIRSEGVRATRAAKKRKSSVSGVDTNNVTNENNEQQTEEDYKHLGLKVVSSLGDELQNVRKAAILDADQLTMSVASLGHRLVKTKEFLNTSMKSLDEESGFHHKLKHFAEQSQTDVALLLEEEKKIRSLVRGTVDYFHGSAGKDEGLRLFVVVRDFLAMLDKVCKEVKEASKAAPSKEKTKQPSQTHQSFNDPRRSLFPAIQDRRTDISSSSSDEDI